MSQRRPLLIGIAVLVAVLLAAAGGVLVARNGGTGDGNQDAEDDQRQAAAAVVTMGDLPGASIGSGPEVAFETYGKCFASQPLLGLTGVGRTAAAQSPAYRLNGTTVGATVVLAEKAEDTIVAFDAVSDSDVFACITEAVDLIRDRGPQTFNQSETDEVIREPPVGDQSIAFRTERRSPLSTQDSTVVVMIARRGRGMAFLFTWSSGGQVFPDAERVRLANLMAERLPV